MDQQEMFLHPQQQHSLAPAASSMAQAQAAPQKKRRNQPGTPNPDAEVIALSPNSLMATNRFLCEVCNKGFQREQNLQLHRRGHNLPWKLKQKTTKEVKRKVYLCPEPTCVHHDPSRALGDLTGIKKHYFRKHGEKKFKCEKCSKKYAVQSDWKAHSKTCGTREYRCDCGTLFSRRDSFITHRAFCDALAQETARNPPILSTISSHLYGSNNINLGFSKLGSTISDQNHPSSTDILRLGSTSNTKTNGQFDQNYFNFGTSMPPTNSFFLQESNQDYAANKPIPGLMQLPNLQNNMFNLNFFQTNSAGLDNDGGNSNLSSGLFGDHISTSSIPSLYSSQVESNFNSTSSAAPMSATALLQKAAQMGSSTSNNSNTNTASLLKAAFGACGSFSSGIKSDYQPVNFDIVPGSATDGGNHLHDLVDGVNAYGGRESQVYNTATKLNYEQLQPPQKKQLTRDFLGVGEIVRSMSGGFSSQREKQQHDGIMNMMSSLDSDQSQQSFASAGNFQ